MYSFIPFLEKPYYCYKKTTFYTVKDKTDDQCDKNIEMIGIYIEIDEYYRIPELFFLFSFVAIQIALWGQRKALGKYSVHYRILQISLLVLIIACFSDITFSLIFGYYPLINFFIRGIIIILLIRNLRLVWVNIIYLLYDTRNVFFLLLASLFWFGLVGRCIFPYNPDFKDTITSMYSLFILLATCNFPDVMLGTFSMDEKKNAFFFIIFIIMNFFIILSLLKSLYYSSYFEIYKERARKLIRYLNEKDRDLEKIIETEFKNKSVQIEEKEAFHKLLIKISKNYSFTKEEYKTLLSLVGLKDVELFSEEFFSIWKKNTSIPEKSFIAILRKRKVELFLTIFDMVFNVFILVINTDNSIIGLALQLIWCFLFIFELGCYIYYEGLCNFVKNDLIRFLYLFVNLLYFIGLVFALFYVMISSEKITSIMHLIYPLVMLRSIRFIVMLNFFQEFRIIFTTLHNMKRLFYGLMSTLFSFFFIFSTLSMFFTGGKITKDAFDDSKDIPPNYKYLNFNDFLSSFMSCFALMMINNTNILSRSLSYGVGKFFRAYFAAFYFMAALIILNIIQTLLLEMYLSIKANKIEEEDF